jgi:hypothetical protein
MSAALRGKVLMATDKAPFSKAQKEEKTMAPTLLGRVNVPASGTAVRLAATPTPCSRIRVSVVAGLTGKCYFGTSAVDHSTRAGVIKELWPNGGGVDDAYEIYTEDGSNSLHLEDYSIDVAISGEGLIVSYWTNRLRSSSNI